MNSYTGGFWEIDDINPNDVKIVGNDKIIATIERGEGITHKEHKANARLIKHAPTLKSCAEIITYHHEEMLNYFQDSITPEAVKVMRAQIAKLRRQLILIEGE